MGTRTISDPPRFSVVTPTLNMGDRLARCIDSVRKQNYAYVEHIVIDACSTDGTLQLLESSEGVTWISEPDRGQSDAINKGLRMATGDLIGWLNADDVLEPGALERIVQTARANPTAGLFYGDVVYVEPERSWRRSPAPHFSLDGLCRRNTVLQPGSFWTRWAQEVVGELDENFQYAMDYEYWIRFAKSGVEAVYVPHVLARFEIHDASKTGGQDGTVFALDEAAALRKHGEDHWAAAMLERWYIRKAAYDVAQLTRSGRPEQAAQLAATSLPKLTPILDQARWFLLLARRAPRLAGFLYRIRGSRTT